jgi:hypothetical protein
VSCFPVIHGSALLDLDLDLDLVVHVDLACEQRILPSRILGQCVADADVSLSASRVPTLASDDPRP